MTDHTVIPFYNEALFTKYFKQYKSEAISEDIGEDYICDDYLIASNDLVEELLEKISALGYSITFSLHTEDSECYGLDVEPDDPSLYFSNAINVVLDGHVRVKIMGLNDRLGPRFIVTSTLEKSKTQEIIDLLKQIARISPANIEKRANNYNRRRVLLPQMAVQKRIPTGPVGIINSFLGPKGRTNRNLSYIFHKAQPRTTARSQSGGKRLRKRNYTRKRKL